MKEQVTKLYDYFFGYWCKECNEQIPYPPEGKNNEYKLGFRGYYHSDCYEQAKKRWIERMRSILSDKKNTIETPNRGEKNIIIKIKY